MALEELGEIVSGKSLEDEVQSRELDRALDGFLRGLAKRDRELFLRRYWGTETLESLAKQTGLSLGAVHRRLGKLRESLRDHLQKEGIDL